MKPIICAIRQTIVASLAAIVSTSPAVALADDNTFQTEGGLFYSSSSFAGYGFQTRSSLINGRATYYFSKLPTSPQNCPLELTQFVERIGSFSASYYQTSMNSDVVEMLRRGDGYNATVNFAQPDNPYFIGAAYRSSYSGKLRYPDTIYFNAYDHESYGDAYNLSIGTYLRGTTAITLGWSRDNLRGKTTSSLGSFESKQVTDTTSLSIYDLERFGGETYAAFSSGISQTATDYSGISTKSSSFFLGGTYYPKKVLGLGLSFGTKSGDGTVGSTNSKSYTASTQMFFTPMFSLYADYSYSSTTVEGFSAYDYNFRYLSLGASMRF